MLIILVSYVKKHLKSILLYSVCVCVCLCIHTSAHGGMC